MERKGKDKKKKGNADGAREVDVVEDAGSPSAAAQAGLQAKVRGAGRAGEVSNVARVALFLACVFFGFGVAGGVNVFYFAQEARLCGSSKRLLMRMEMQK